MIVKVIQLAWYEQIKKLGINERIIPQGLSNKKYAELYKLINHIKQCDQIFTDLWQLTALTADTSSYNDFTLLKDNGSRTLAHFAVWSGSNAALDWVKTNAPDLLEDKTNQGFTIAHYAAEIGRLEVLVWIRTNAPWLLEGKSNWGGKIAFLAQLNLHYNVLEWMVTNTPHLLSVDDKSFLAQHEARSGNVEQLNNVLSVIENSEEFELLITERTKTDTLINDT